MMQGIMTTTDLNEPLKLVEIPKPIVLEHDILVKVAASGVNPVDIKQCELAVATNASRILGFDAVGEVVEIGNKVSRFQVGDRVFYAGQVDRMGANAELQAVDERLVALAPSRLTNTEAAALPLTFITAYELLHDKFGLEMAENSAKHSALLVINGAGGVGSAMIQLAKWLGMTVIATASRPDTVAWVEKMGADHVVSHREDYVTELRRLGFDMIPYIAILHAPEKHIKQAGLLVGPFGHVGAIVEPLKPLDVAGLKNKSASLDWEFMFAKGNYGYHIETQGRALELLKQLVETSNYQTTLVEVLSGFNPLIMKQAYDRVAQNNMIGKLVIEY